VSAVGRSILHVDMDAFFVSVELLDAPELRGRPVVVGGAGPRGVVAAASYEARSHGVFSAMPMSTALRLCPHLVVLAGRHGRYAEVSASVMSRFRSVTPLVEPLSLDEAFLDVSGARRSLGPAVSIAARLIDEILEQDGLRCSVGVAPNKFLAKLASEAAKPSAAPAGPVPGRGVVVVLDTEVAAFLDPLPIRAMWGVGPKTAERLSRLGVRTIGDLTALPLDAVVASVGRSNGEHLHALAHGVDERPVVSDGVPRSISSETTFPTDRDDLDGLASELVGFADSVAGRLRAAGLVARTVSLKVRHPGFELQTRAETLDEPTDDGLMIAVTAQRLLGALDVSGGVRLIGVGVSNLEPPRPVQLRLELDDPSLFDHATRARVNDLVDTIRARFGTAAIGPASGSGGSRGNPDPPR